MAIPRADVRRAWSNSLTGISLGLDPSQDIHEWPRRENRRLQLQDLYQQKQIIGKGAFGIAVNAVHKPSQTRVVLKIISKRGEHDEDYAKTFVTVDGVYTLFLSLRPHVNVVRYVDALEVTGHYCIMMEPLTGPELFEFLELGAQRPGLRRRGAAAELLKTIQHMMKQMLRALAVTAENGLIHRDVKVDAFRFRSADAPTAPLVLFDFGLCCLREPNIWLRGTAERRQRGVCGTLEYAAPEMATGAYDEKIDVWSAGICFYVMLTARLPFDRAASTRVPGLVTRAEMEAALASRRLRRCPPAVVACLQRLLEFDPRRRPSAADALAVVSDDDTFAFHGSPDHDEGGSGEGGEDGEGAVEVGAYANVLRQSKASTCWLIGAGINLSEAEVATSSPEGGPTTLGAGGSLGSAPPVAPGPFTPHLQVGGAVSGRSRETCCCFAEPRSRCSLS